MLFDDKTKGIAQAYLSMLGESHFKVGDKVKCKASGKTGTVTKLDKEDGSEDEKYYTVKQDSGKVMKYAPNELSKLNESKLDPVNPKAVKKKFDDRMDKDIDNDGDVDDSDEYLHKRRKAISKAVKKEAIEIEMQKKSKMNGSDDDDDEDMVAKGNDKMKVKKNSKKDDEENMKEDVEGLDELSKKTVGSYIKKASDDRMWSGVKAADSSRSSSTQDAASRRATKRKQGIAKATDRLTREDFEQVDELSKDLLTRAKNKAVGRAVKADVDGNYTAMNVADKQASKFRKAANLKDLSKAKQRVVKNQMKEDVEELDELTNHDYTKDLLKFSKVVKSVKTPEQFKTAQRMGNALLKKYRDMPSTVLDKIGKFLGHDISWQPERKYDVEDELQRKKKELETALNKEMKEDVEELDELSRKTLKSYTKKAGVDASNLYTKAHHISNQNQGKKSDKLSALAQKAIDKSDKRVRGHNKALARLNKEDFEWNWDAILEAPEEEIDAMIEEMSDDDLESFVSEFEQLEEGGNWYQASTNSVQPMGADGRETLDPRAPADRAFANAHRQDVNIKDYPGKDKPVTNAKPQAPARPGEKRNPEPRKTLSDIRNKMK